MHPLRVGLLCAFAFIGCQAEDRSRPSRFLGEASSDALRTQDEIAVRTVVARALPPPCCGLRLTLDTSLFVVDIASSMPRDPQRPRALGHEVVGALLRAGTIGGLAPAWDTVPDAAAPEGAVVSMSPLYRWEHSDTVMVAVLLRVDPPSHAVLPDTFHYLTHIWYLVVRDDSTWRVRRVETARPQILEVGS